jgi:hypothetical protein
MLGERRLREHETGGQRPQVSCCPRNILKGSFDINSHRFRRVFSGLIRVTAIPRDPGL